MLALLALPGCQAQLTEGTSTAAGGASVAYSVGANAAASTGISLGVQALGRAGLHTCE